MRKRNLRKITISKNITIRVIGRLNPWQSASDLPILVGCYVQHIPWMLRPSTLTRCSWLWRSIEFRCPAARIHLTGVIELWKYIEISSKDFNIKSHLLVD